MQTGQYPQGPNGRLRRGCGEGGFLSCLSLRAGVHTVIDATGGSMVHPGCDTVFGGETVSDLEDFLDKGYVESLPVSLTTSDRFGRITTLLRRKGKPMPTNDIWIAAHTMESGAELLTLDRHFEHIDGLIWTRF